MLTRYRFIYPISKAIFTFTRPIKAYGRKNIPEGGAVICANHAFNSDPFYVVYAIPPRHKVNIMTKAEIRQWPVVGGFLQWLGFVIWVKRGKGDIGAVKSALSCLRKQEKLLIFPEGTRHEEIGEGKNGAAMFAIRTGVPILPVYLTQVRKTFHRVKVFIGEPYMPFTEERRANSKDYDAATAVIMEKIRALREKAEAEGLNE